MNLYPGRSLDQQQVSAMLHLIASSIPDLSAKNVTIVDQNGNLLSDPNKQAANHGLDPNQLKYVQEYQQNLVKRIEALLTPIVGANNIRAEATADIDFSKSEQAAETYRPNTPPEGAAIRSQQSSESYNKGTNPSGVPGALTNQPPVPATAPIVASGAATASNAAATGLTQKDSTTNYEVDKTIRYTQQAMGGLKRLTVALLVNYKNEYDKNGKATPRPLTDIEKAQITELVKDAIGFSKDRGDSINLVNSPFAPPEKEAIVDLPLWKQPEMIQMAKEYGRYLLVFLVLAYLFFGFLKPILYKIMGKDKETLAAAAAAAEAEKAALEAQAAAEEEDEDAVVSLSDEASHAAHPSSSYETNLTLAREFAKNDPRIVANVIKAWMSNE